MRVKPMQVADLELSEPDPFAAVLAAAPAFDGAWLLVRLWSEPLAAVRLSRGMTITEETLRLCVLTEVGTALDERLPGDGSVAERLTAARALPLTGPQAPAFLRRRAEVLAEAPKLTVVICTREQPTKLARALESLVACQYPNFAVLVVDNAPVGEATREVVRSFEQRLPISYLLEPAAGLSRARNAALAALDDDDIIAWLDDDETVDEHWLAELARGYADYPWTAGVSGSVVPYALDDPAQVWFEDFGGHSKGRGFGTVYFNPASDTWGHPLFPLPPYGVGANMSQRVSALRAIGGFDPALGAGTSTAGGEDTLALSKLLRAGFPLLYLGSAITRHEHRSDLAGLAKQMRGYGTGLTAYYAAVLRDDPLAIFPLMRLAPKALVALRSSDGDRNAGMGEDFPHEIMKGNLTGMVKGPFLYARERWRHR